MINNTLTNNSTNCKTCSKCKVEKTLDNFHKRKDKFTSHCKSCNNEDRKKYPGRWEDREFERRKFIWDYKTQHSCVNCGENNPIVLIFDHLEEHKKSFDISNCKKGLSFLKEEIGKCQVLCSNCHAKKTSKQFGWYKDFITEDM